jgi:hypothetical protein
VEQTEYETTLLLFNLSWNKFENETQFFAFIVVETFIFTNLKLFHVPHFCSIFHIVSKKFMQNYIENFIIFQLGLIRLKRRCVYSVSL